LQAMFRQFRQARCRAFSNAFALRRPEHAPLVRRKLVRAELLL
jgi:hypothetical protein